MNTASVFYFLPEFFFHNDRMSAAPVCESVVFGCQSLAWCFRVVMKRKSVTTAVFFRSCVQELVYVLGCLVALSRSFVIFAFDF